MNNLRNLFFLGALFISSVSAFHSSQESGIEVFEKVSNNPDNLEITAVNSQLASREYPTISYKHKTELVLGNAHGFALPNDVESYAKSRYSYLNESIMFKTTFVRDVQAVREFHTDANNLDRGQLISIMTNDGVEIKCTYFDRGSDILIVVGPGFTNEREVMTPFVEMFRKGSTGGTGCDVVLMDFRGHGYEPKKFNDPASWITCDLAKNTFGIDSRESMLGEVEEQDVFAIVNNFRSHKKYKQVCGVSLCFGSFVFLKAEAIYPGLFDKIVVDGCWDSLDKVVSKIRYDAKLVCKPQTGGWKDYWLSKQKCLQDSAFWCARNIFNLNFEHDLHLTDYLPKITKTPVLFFYGKNDLMVYRDEFEDLFNAVAAPYKVAVITSNPHVMNQYKQKELYKHICETFFKCSTIDAFEKEILDVSVSGGSL